MISGIILAAGRSTRMGQAKASLRVEGESFLERCAHILRAAGCERVIAVVNASADPTRAGAGIDVVVNPDPESEQIDSLRLAVQRVEQEATAVLVLPVDLPLVDERTAAAVTSSFRAQPSLIVAPAYGGVAGHPILLAQPLFDEILRRDWEHGVRSLLEAHVQDMRTIDVPDAGVLIDIDTPDDYTQHIGPQ